MFGGPREEMDAFLPVLGGRARSSEARIERTVYPQNGLVLLDVIAPGVGKARGARLSCRSAGGSPPRETLAIGDNWNDREMLEEAGLGFVMGNADPGLHGLGLPVLAHQRRGRRRHRRRRARARPVLMGRAGRRATPSSTVHAGEARGKRKGGDCSPPDRGRRVAYFFLAFFFGAAFFFAAIAFIPPLKPFGVLCRRWTPSGHEQEKSGG